MGKVLFPYLQKLKRMGLHEMWDAYEEAFGNPPPRTKSLKWLYYNCAYMHQEQHGDITPNHTRRFTEWAKQPTPEQNMVTEFKKLRVPQLKELCKEHNIPWKAKKTERAKMMADLAWAMAELEPIINDGAPPVAVVVTEKGVKTVKNTKITGDPKVKSRRTKGTALGGLPGTIKELLALKEECKGDKKKSRDIRRALRNLDPNWNKKK